MRVSLRCGACQSDHTIEAEPRQLLGWQCPQCGGTTEARALEDLASALEDAMVAMAVLARVPMAPAARGVGEAGEAGGEAGPAGGLGVAVVLGG